MSNSGELNRPDYYSDTPLQFLKERSFEEFQGWCIGNAIHYLFRLGRKESSDPVEDLSKAITDLQFLKSAYENGEAWRETENRCES